MPSSRQILVVDDEPEVLKLAKMMLDRVGFGTTATTDPRAALSAFSDQQNGFDLVLTDVAMPGMNGNELVAQVRRINPSQAILFITADPAQITESGPFLEKPFTSARLVSAVCDALAGPVRRSVTTEGRRSATSSWKTA